VKSFHDAHSTCCAVDDVTHCLFVVSCAAFFIDWMAPKSTPDSRRKRALAETRERVARLRSTKAEAAAAAGLHEPRWVVANWSWQRLRDAGVLFGDGYEDYIEQPRRLYR
jgi:hypothetical protein